MQSQFVLLSFVFITTFVIIAFQAQFLIHPHNLFSIPTAIFAQELNKSTTQIELPTLRDGNLSTQLVATGINFPANMAFLKDGSMLVTEKNTGLVKRVINGTVLEKPVLQVKIDNYWEGGLLGIDVDKHKEPDSPAYVYLYYSQAENNTKGAQGLEGNVLYRFEYNNGKLVNPKLLVTIPYPQNFTHIHNGGIVLDGPDKNIYLIVGDYGQKVTSFQNIKSNLTVNGSGGIFRLTKNGSAAEGNPLGGNFSKYYAYGIRNSFGMTFDPITGNIWDTEDGPDYGDEVNLVDPGFNSGWVKIQGTSDLYSLHNKKQFNSDRLVNLEGKGKYSDPELAWNQTIGITAIKFLDSKILGENYENDLFVGDFNNGNIYHFDLNSNRTGLVLDSKLSDKLVNNEKESNSIIFGQGFGAILDMKVGPNGYLYILSLYDAREKCAPNTSYANCYKFNDAGIHGSIFRIVPARH